MSESKYPFPTKCVRVMADYCADPVWHEDGCNGHLDSLPLSDALKARLLDWAWFFDRFGDDYKDRSERKFPDDYHDEWGHRLALAVKEELPDWTVYHNHIEITQRSDNE